MSPEQNDYLGQPLPVEPEAGTAEESRIEPSKKIRMFGDSTGLGVKHEFKRALNTTGQGATRVRIFHSKLSDTGLAFIEEQINEWLDEHPGIEVKFTSSTVGILEGKRSEPNLFLSVWY